MKMSFRWYGSDDKVTLENIRQIPGLEPISLQQLTAPMSRARIAEVAAAFGRSAALAKKLGFDAVEIQGAHGYLIEQFLRKETKMSQCG